MSPFVKLALTYTLSRMAIFAVCVIALDLCGLRGFPLLLVALFASGVLALPLARGQRERLTSAWQVRRESRDPQ